MRQLWFHWHHHLHHHSHPEAIWIRLFVFFTFLMVALLIGLAVEYGWQLPVTQPSWAADFRKTVPTPIGPH